jgi:Xaa-Pro aminopeptidase
MKIDIDRYMAEAGIDALLVTGQVEHNPPMYYLTGGGKLTHADLIKPRDRDPVLFYNTMERDAAAATGLHTKNLVGYDIRALIEKHAGDQQRAYAERYKLMLADLGIDSGRISVYGQADVGQVYGRIKLLNDMMPEAEFIGEEGNTVIRKAMATKDEEEIARIRAVGEVTVAVVDRVRRYLSSHRVRKGTLVDEDDTPVTIADVKSRINLWLSEAGVDNPHGTIFAIGRDAGVPHNVGNPEDTLKLGQTIVFDIFPQERGGGYHYDFTRTWSLGYASEAVESIYDDVRTAYEQVMDALVMHGNNSDYQELVCDLFEAGGHPTIRDGLGNESGYVHSLGHGLGLFIHESPSMRNAVFATDFDRLHPGTVVTIEPGLYYPDRGIGCRLEDTVWVRPDGGIEKLVDYPLDLVIPVRGD